MKELFAATVALARSTISDNKSSKQKSLTVEELVKILTPCHKTVFTRMEKTAEEARQYLSYVLRRVYRDLYWLNSCTVLRVHYHDLAIDYWCCTIRYHMILVQRTIGLYSDSGVDNGWLECN